MYPSLTALPNLFPHEEVSAEHLEELLLQLQKDGCMTKAIIADRTSKVILDGHHRWNAAKLLHLRLIPVFFVDLWDESITVEAFRNDFPVSKELVIRHGTSCTLLPCKTTRHVYGPCRLPITDAFPPVNISLQELQ